MPYSYTLSCARQAAHTGSGTALCEAGLVNAALPSALDALFVAARGPDAFAAAPMTGAGLW